MTCRADQPPGPRLEQIRASAGSGKTYTLTSRFVALLDQASFTAAPYAGRAPSSGNASCYAWSELLAATFTNKAAAEMKERVITALKKRALGLEGAPKAPAPQALSSGARPGLADPEAARRVDYILRHYSLLNIRTIDSLFVLFARLSALNLGLPPDFCPSFNAREYFQPLFDAMAVEAGEHDGQARQALEALCRARLYWNETSRQEYKRFLPGADFTEPLLRILNIALQNPAKLPAPVDEREIFARIKLAEQTLADSAAALLERLEAENLRGSQKFLAFLQETAKSGELYESVYATKTELDDCLLKNSRGKASKTAIHAFGQLHAACMQARNAALLRKALLTMPMLRLIEPLTRHLIERMSGEGLVPAILMPRLAAHVFRDAQSASEAFCRMGARLHHLLIDEFQDTSREQWQTLLPLAVECLSKGGSLTCVGDSKQAIYGFRGGEAALFDEALAEQALMRITPAPLRTVLSYNWRSAPVIVNHNNAIFSQLESPDFARQAAAALLPEKTPDAILAETAATLLKTFAGTTQHVPPEKKWDAEGYVRLIRIRGENAAMRDEQIRTELYRIVEEVLLRRPAGDIAVLTRTNKQAALTAEQLLDRGIPVLTENSLFLGAHPIIQRITSFLEFLNNPLNGLALYEFLCGPELFGMLSGMDRTAVENWLAQAFVRQSPAPCNSSWVAPAFRHDFPEIWERCIAPFHSRAGLMGAYDLVHELLNFYNVLRHFPDETVFLRRFLELVHGAENEGHIGLSSFLAWWQESRDHEKLPMPESMNAVQVLTMHKAKGLEFPVVIIPYGDRRRDQENEYVRHTVEGLDLLLPCSSALGQPYFRHVAARALETVNLLYVAWTRPTEELYAFLTSTPQTKHAPQAAILSLLTAGLDWDADGVFEQGVRPKQPKTTLRAPHEEPDAMPEAMPDAMPNAMPDTMPKATPAAFPSSGAPDQPLEDAPEDPRLPEKTPNAIPDATPDTTPDAMPEAMPDAMPNAIPEATPEATPDAMPDAMPNAMPKATPAAFPSSGAPDRPLEDAPEDPRLPEKTPNAMPKATPDAMPEATPNAIPDAMPEATPDAMPDAMPNAMPKATPAAFPSSGAPDRHLEDAPEDPRLPEKTPNAMPKATPDAMPEATPNAIPDAMPEAIPDAPPNARSSAADAPQADADTAPGAAVPMSWLPRLKIFRNTLEFPLFEERQRGLLVHACLEKLGPAARSATPHSAVRPVVQSCMDSFPLPIPDPEQVLEDIASMLCWLLQQPDMACWIADGIPEQEIMDDQGRLLRADLAVHYPAHSVVLEYKTGVAPENALLPLPAHAGQLLRYMRITRSARQCPVRGFLVYLDHRKCIEVPLS